MQNMWRQTWYGESHECDHVCQGQERGENIVNFVWRNLWTASYVYIQVSPRDGVSQLTSVALLQVSRRAPP